MFFSEIWHFCQLYTLGLFQQQQKRLNLLWHHWSILNWILLGWFICGLLYKCILQYLHQKVEIIYVWLIFVATFSNISAISWRQVLAVEKARILREPPTMGKQLINFITCGCESSAPFFVIYKAGCDPTPYWW